MVVRKFRAIPFKFIEADGNTLHDVIKSGHRGMVAVHDTVEHGIRDGGCEYCDGAYCVDFCLFDADREEDMTGWTGPSTCCNERCVSRGMNDAWLRLEK